MDVLREILHALWQQDFSKLADPNVIWVIYGILYHPIFRKRFTSRLFSPRR